jgi:hypothetical protein
LNKDYIMNATIETNTVSATDDRYAGKVPGRVRVTAAETALNVVADTLATALNTHYGVDGEYTVDIVRDKAKRYARVQYNVFIQSSDRQTVNTGMTIEEVHCFISGMMTGLAWTDTDSVAFRGDPADYGDMGQDDGGSAPVEPENPQGDQGSDGVAPEKVLETVDTETAPIETVAEKFAQAA